MGGLREFIVHWGPTTHFNQRWMSPLTANKTFRETERSNKRSNSLSLVRSAGLWTDRLGCLPFFSEGDRINSKLVYAVPKINLIQKGSGGQRHHLPCPLRQIIAKIVSTLCTQELKLETLTIQYTKGFCCLVLRTVLLSRHCPSAEEDDSWQVEASPRWQRGPGGALCQGWSLYVMTPASVPHGDTSFCTTHESKAEEYGIRRLRGWCSLQLGHYASMTLLQNLAGKYIKYEVHIPDTWRRCCLFQFSKRNTI